MYRGGIARKTSIDYARARTHTRPTPRPRPPSFSSVRRTTRPKKISAVFPRSIFVFFLRFPAFPSPRRPADKYYFIDEGGAGVVRASRLTAAAAVPPPTLPCLCRSAVCHCRVNVCTRVPNTYVFGDISVRLQQIQGG